MSLQERTIDIVDEFYRPRPSGILVPKIYRPYPIAFDFFAGCGGFSLGLIQAGFEVLGACEIDCGATHTYLYNLGNYPVQVYYTSQGYRDKLAVYFEANLKNRIKNSKKNEVIEPEIAGSGWRKSEREHGCVYPGVSNFFFGSIREMTGKEVCDAMGIEVGELDLIVGGPPCQGFSKAGKQNVNDPRNSLVFEYARMLAEMHPKTFVMEEVPAILQMRTPQGVPVIDQFLRILEDGNYLSYEAGMKALDIREKDIGVRPKYVVHPGRKNKPGPEKKNVSKPNKPVIPTNELTLF